MVFSKSGVIALTIVPLALSLLSMSPSNAQVTDQEADASLEQGSSDEQPNEPCCGGTGIRWHYKRLVEGEIVDESYLIPDKGRWVYDVHPSKSGGILQLGALIFPFEKGGEPFPFEENTRYYDGQVPGVGRIVAVEYEPGEEWVFDYGGYEIIDNEGFTPGVLEFEVKSELHDRWSETWSGMISNGVWAEVNCTDQIDYIIGSSGMQWEELSVESRELGLVEIGFPVCQAHFYGRCHDVGEVWTVKIGDEVCTATVTEKDPNATPIDLIDYGVEEVEQAR